MGSPVEAGGGRYSQGVAAMLSRSSNTHEDQDSEIGEGQLRS